jgi:hypothetical protein
MKKIITIIIISLLFVAIITLGTPLKLFAEDINVPSCESIQSGINSALANSSDVNYIYIESGTYSEQLIINIPSGREIHLIGSSSDTTVISLPSGVTGNVISADGGGKIYLEKVKITNGTRSGIRINNSTVLLISYCEISNNESSIGGGIYNYGSIININNSKIISNKAALCGGGIYNDGTATITNSLISNNSSTNSDGGGIYNLGNLIISDCSINNNSSVNHSGIASISSVSGIVNSAENNWWGSDSGPYSPENNPLGTGDSVADNVSFYPFLLSDPFAIGTEKDDEEEDGDNNNGDTQNPSASEENNDSAGNLANIADNSIYGSSNFFNTDGFSLKYYLSLYAFPSKGFITLLYNSILLREPDTEGLDHWEYLLDNNIKSASDIAECLFFSEENISRILKKNNSEFLEYLYSGILFRKPDSEGFDSWLAAINSGMPRKYLFRSFTSSEEWKNICAEFKINP